MLDGSELVETRFGRWSNDGGIVATSCGCDAITCVDAWSLIYSSVFLSSEKGCVVLCSVRLSSNGDTRLTGEDVFSGAQSIWSGFDQG